MCTPTGGVVFVTELAWYYKSLVYGKKQKPTNIKFMSL